MCDTDPETKSDIKKFIPYQLTCTTTIIETLTFSSSLNAPNSLSVIIKVRQAILEVFDPILSQ